ncbi:MAG: hypothetical protein Q9190_003099 [Brigantiaea leucoxantha]
MSSASSPISAPSPKILVPSSSYVVNKSGGSISGPLLTPSIFTNKEWVIPPRPKPGRKPAADTPPTKRKAQNRAAQRAFRERRAARVGELEEQMKKIEEEDQKEQEDLRAQIRQLEVDAENYQKLLLSWQERFQQLEDSLREETRLRQNSEKEINMLRQGQIYRTEAVPLPLRRSSGQKHTSPMEAQQQPPENNPYEDLPMDCGKCRYDRCECIEQAFDMNNLAAEPPDPHAKRPHSPPSAEDSKRVRPATQVSSDDTEIDFTAQFSTKRPMNPGTEPSTTSIPTTTNPDQCGFCQDGAPCICAEMVLEAAKAELRNANPRNSGSVSTNTPSNPCINGPGTCAQCLSDPTSTLFCKSLAASRSNPRSNNSTAPIRSTPAPTEGEEAPSPDPNRLTLSCADAYETLSRHPAFEQASQELSTWMPRLATVPGGVQRTAFEVEAASVMGVLKFFDRRFGAGRA